jgi:hypothetical protein
MAIKPVAAQSAIAVAGNKSNSKTSKQFLW